MNKIIKLFLTLIAIGAILWLGGNIMRSVIAYDIFEPVKDLPVKTDKPYDALFQTAYLYSMLSLYTTIGYIMCFVSVLFLTFKLKDKLRKSGWIFMAIVLFLLFSPIEFIRIYYDFQMSWVIFIEEVRDFYHGYINDYFIERYRSIWFTSLSTLSVFANITAIIFIIWKPLELTNNNDVE